jgi:hypothetical protein
MYRNLIQILVEVGFLKTSESSSSLLLPLVLVSVPRLECALDVEPELVYGYSSVSKSTSSSSSASAGALRASPGAFLAVRSWNGLLGGGCDVEEGVRFWLRAVSLPPTKSAKEETLGCPLECLGLGGGVRRGTR